jgi:hypothetical protein
VQDKPAQQASETRPRPDAMGPIELFRLDDRVQMLSGKLAILTSRL